MAGDYILGSVREMLGDNTAIASYRGMASNELHQSK
jgi:hypothetical protein